MDKEKKIFILIFSTFLVLTTIFVPLIFIFKNGEQPNDYDYDERSKQPDYIEFEYQKIYKKLLEEYFKKNKPNVEKYICESITKEIEDSKKKSKEEDFDNEWNKILANKNVKTEEEFYEKRIFEQQNKTFYDIFL